VEGNLEVLSGEAAATGNVSPLNPSVDVASQPYIGRWHHLISTTNWEKGRIIAEWRTALIEANSAAAEYADEAWARRVGGVTGQHVGRLRRVYQRFGLAQADYAGIYWSHFQAALDWDDAELWLEGAVQSAWSVSEMRRKRWESMGSLAADRPRDEDIVAAETDEDADPNLDRDAASQRSSGQAAESPSRPLPEGPDFGDETAAVAGEREQDGASIFAADPPGEAVPFVRPFENLAELPEDLAEAFEAFKLALLRHKTDHWRQISCEDVLASLDALKELALAPSLE
jgi:hypothetical protein